MGKVKIEEIIYGKWGNCIKISNDIVEVVATVDFGPRIIRYSILGKENMFLEDKDFKGTNSGKQFKVFGEDKMWRIYGGHRLWASPEKDPRTYYPDDEKVDYKETSTGVILCPKEEKWTQLKKEMEISLDEGSSKVTVNHRIFNMGAWNIEIAPWAISAMSQGGIEVILQSKRDTALLPNRIIALWPYSKINDSRVCFEEEYITLRQDPKIERAFKIGINNEEGLAAYFNNDCMFVKHYHNNINGKYPDYGVSYETYTNFNVLEMETVGEMKIVQPGECTQHEEVWELFDNVKMPTSTKELKQLREYK